MLRRKIVYGLRVVAVVRCDGEIELDNHARALQVQDRADNARVCLTAAAEGAIGLRRRAVERDVDAARRICGEKLDHIIVYQRCVGVDRENEPHAFAAGVNFAKIRAEQRLTAGQQEHQRSLAAALLRKREPLRRTAFGSSCSRVMFGAVDVAHFAAEVAARRQLERAGKRHAQHVRAREQALVVDVIGVHKRLLFHIFQNPSRTSACSSVSTARTSGVQARA